MDSRFSIHNLHLESVDYFIEHDPNLRKLNKLKLIYKAPLIEQLPRDIPGVYILVGGRQVGKTTFTKQWMKFLLEKNIDPLRINFLTGDIIDDYKQLISHCEEIVSSKHYKNTALSYLIIDEITYIKEWDRGIKFLVDAGLLENTILLLTGSDSNLLTEAMVRFPGRRGQSDKQDFELMPLSFRETIELKENVEIENATDDDLEKEWKEYLIHGGYLTAINQFVEKDIVLNSTLKTYSDWIRGDFLKKNKNENSLKEVLLSLQKRQGSQITWNSLAKDLSIEHPTTLFSYIEILASMQVIYIQSALDQSKLSPSPKKAKKIHFLDPFIFHSIKAWLFPVEDAYREQISKLESDNELLSVLAEAVAISHVKRKKSVYYIKSDGEVDIAYLEKNAFIPIEVKWGKQIRNKDLKQISKYSEAGIWSKQRIDRIHNINNSFLPRALLQW